MEEKKENKEEKVEKVKATKKEENKKAETKKVKEKKEKKSKKTPWIITAVTVVVVAILVVLLTYMIVTSSDPKKSADGLFMNLREGDFAKAREFISSDESFSSEILDDDLNPETQKLLFNKLSWKVNKINENGEEATIDIEITNKDFKTILSNDMQKTLKSAFNKEDSEETTEEVAENYLIEELKNDQVQTTTVTTTINAIKQDKKWKIVEDEELVKALLPGLEETINSLV